MSTTLTRRGPNANRPARLPGLQTSRVADPNVRQALDKLREWVEVRLGSRGDEFERAVTKRELDPLIDALVRRIAVLEDAAKNIEGTTSVSSENSSRLAAELAALRTSSQSADAALRAEFTRLSSRLSRVVAILGIDA